MTKIYCDGSSLGNPGYMGAGIFVPDTGFKWSACLGWGTIKQAEFIALTKAIELADSKANIQIVLKRKARGNIRIFLKLRETLRVRPNISIGWVHWWNIAQKMALETVNSLAKEAACPKR